MRGTGNRILFGRASRLAIVGALGLAPLAVQAQATHDASRTRPNILLIISDDVGVDASTGMYRGLVGDLTRLYGPEGRNHPEYQRIDQRPASTPVLDALARDGMAFTQAWANPFCSPTRASMLTGLFTSKTDVATYADPLSQNHRSFVADLRDEGYATAVFGKWHIAGLPGQPRDYPGMKPKEAGFERFYGNMHAALPTFWNYPVHVQDAATADSEWRTEERSLHTLPGVAATDYADVGWAAETIGWIEQQEAADPDRPWFGWLAFNLAHATAIQTPSAMMVPNADTLDEPTRREIEACGGEFGSQNVGQCSGETLFRAMTNSMDTLIGKVLAAVDGLDPNTYVIFIGDNGTPMYGRPNLDFIDNMYITRNGRGKSTAFESGARVPLVIRGPEIAPGTRSDEFVHAADLFATVLEMAGIAVPDSVPDSAGTATTPLDAVSLMPILSAQADRVRDPDRGYILTESTNLMTAANTQVVGARNASYKVVCTDSASQCELYNLVLDPLEEYPLEKPASCTGNPPAGSPAWHYCYLTGVVAERSIVRERPGRDASGG